MRKLLVLTALLFGVSAFGQIAGAPGGYCTVAGASAVCTFNNAAPAKALIIIFGHRTGSTTAPGTPTSSTSISTKAGTSSSARMACRVTTASTASITSGTNATNTVAIWYTGTQAGTTANCNSTGINNSIGTSGVVWGSAGSSTTATFGAAVSRWPWDRISGFLGGSASSLCTPSGMTAITSLGTVGAYDTGSNQASWPSTGCTVTSENWITGVVDILGAQDPLTGNNTKIVPVDYYIDLNGNTTIADDTTTACTLNVCTPMATGTHSIQTPTWSASNGATTTGLLISRQNYCPRNVDYYVRGEKIYHPYSGWRSLRIDHGDTSGTGALTGVEATVAFPSPLSVQGSVTGCVYIGAQACDGGQMLVDYIQFQGGTTGHSVTLQFDCGQGVSPARPALNVESGMTGSTVHSNTVSVRPGSFYRFSLYANYKTGLSKALIWNPYTMAIVGEATLQQAVVPETIGNLNVGNTEFYTTASCTGCQGREYSYIEDIAIDMQASYPQGPGASEHTWWKSVVAAATMVPRRAARMVIR